MHTIKQLLHTGSESLVFFWIPPFKRKQDWVADQHFQVFFWFMQELNLIYIIVYLAFCKVVRHANKNREFLFAWHEPNLKFFSEGKNNQLWFSFLQGTKTPVSRKDNVCDRKRKNISHLSLENSHRGSSGRSYSGIGSSCAELRRVVMRTRGVLEFMEELESAETCRMKGDWLITAVWIHRSVRAPRHH